MNATNATEQEKLSGIKKHKDEGKLITSQKCNKLEETNMYKKKENDGNKNYPENSKKVLGTLSSTCNLREDYTTSKHLEEITIDIPNVIMVQECPKVEAISGEKTLIANCSTSQLFFDDEEKKLFEKPTNESNYNYQINANLEIHP